MKIFVWWKNISSGKVLDVWWKEDQVTSRFCSSKRSGSGQGSAPSNSPSSHQHAILILFLASWFLSVHKIQFRWHSSLHSSNTGTAGKVPLRFCCVFLQSPIRDKVEPLVFSLSVSLYEKLPKKRNIVQDLRLFPVLSQAPETLRTQVRTDKPFRTQVRPRVRTQVETKVKTQHDVWALIHSRVISSSDPHPEGLWFW